MPLIGLWVKLLQVPYRYLYPSALFFIAVGVFSTNHNLEQVWEVLAFGVIGAVFAALDFPAAPILLGFVLGPLVEENFRRGGPTVPRQPDGVRRTADQRGVRGGQRPAGCRAAILLAACGAVAAAGSVFLGLALPTTTPIATE